MTPRPSRRALLLSLALLAPGPLAFAQYGPATPDSLPNNYPPPLPERRGPAPKLVFALAGEIALPGPLSAREAWTIDGAVEVPVAAGIARVSPSLDAKPELVTGAPPSEPQAPWVVSLDGSRRYRTTPEGIVEAEKSVARGKRWKLRWRIVAPNSILAPPLLIGPRLCYTGLDDRVTCVRASNGHRLWSVDLADRLSRPIAAWPPLAGASPRAARRDRLVEGEVLLVVPDGGASVVALDAYDGTRIASYDLPAARGRFASPPFVFREGRIAVVRKGYAEDEAALSLLDLTPAPASPGAVPYNAQTPKHEPSSGR